MTDLTEELRIAGIASWLVDAVDRAARRRPGGMSPYLVTVGQDIGLQNSQATCRCRFVIRDPQGPRITELIEMLKDHIVDYCIPRSRIDEAADEYAKYGTSRKFMQLEREARQLFTKLKTSGEGGELLLYALLEFELGLPQLICKMPLKTDSQMHFHGADGLHAKGLPNGHLALYWAESKLYASVNAAITAAFEDLAPYLLRMGDAIDRDILLLRDHIDTGDEKLTAALSNYFDSDKVEAAKIEFRGACLVGFDLADYPDPFEEDGLEITAAMASQLSAWHDRLATALGKRELASFEIEVFCVPLPSVQAFRDGLKRELGLEV